MQGMCSSQSEGGVMPGVKVCDITFAGVPVRVYEPPAGGEGHLRRGLMFIHGGGWAVGTTSEFGHSSRLSGQIEEIETEKDRRSISLDVSALQMVVMVYTVISV